MLRRLWKKPFYILGTFSIHTCVYMMHIVLVFGRVKWLGWGGWESFFSLESGTVRAVRALNRQRIMEIKAERLANGNIMATDCLGQLGHANEAAIEEESIGMEVLALYQRWYTDIHVYAHTYTHTLSEGLKPADRSELSAGGPGSSGEPEISPTPAPAPSHWCQQAACDSPRRLALVPTDTAPRCRCGSSPALHAPSNIYSSRLGPKTEQTSLWTINSAASRTAK